MNQSFDVIIIGGGIVGAATLYKIQKAYPTKRILLLEKEKGLADHQTGNNSGVIHSGIYYKPGSYKARFAKEGSRSMVEFCRQHSLKHDVCGKVIVALDGSELGRLDELHRHVLGRRVLGQGGVDLAGLDVGAEAAGLHHHGLAARRVLAERAAGVARGVIRRHLRRTIGAGAPVDVLVDVSRSVELLVLGTRGRGGFTGMLLGSTSDGVLHHAKGPIMVVPDQADERLADRPSFGPMLAT